MVFLCTRFYSVKQSPVSWLSAEHSWTFNEIGYVSKYKLIGCTDKTAKRWHCPFPSPFWSCIFVIVLNRGFIHFFSNGRRIIIYSGSVYAEGSIFNLRYRKSKNGAKAVSLWTRAWTDDTWLEMRLKVVPPGASKQRAHSSERGHMILPCCHKWTEWRFVPFCPQIAMFAGR